MGMFDNVVVEVPLPDGWELGELQTKDFDNRLTTVKITREGRLLIEDFDLELVPEEERTGPLPFCGMFHRVNKRWRDLDFHGWFEFYGNEPYEWKAFRRREDGVLVTPEGKELPPIIWHRYRAKFTDGNLVTIEVQPD